MNPDDVWSVPLIDNVPRDVAVAATSAVIKHCPYDAYEIARMIFAPPRSHVRTIGRHATRKAEQ